jgi:hypothetical protein
MDFPQQKYLLPVGNKHVLAKKEKKIVACASQTAGRVGNITSIATHQTRRRTHALHVFGSTPQHVSTSGGSLDLSGLTTVMLP